MTDKAREGIAARRARAEDGTEVASENGNQDGVVGAHETDGPQEPRESTD